MIKNNDLPNVTVIATGGTIASSPDNNTGAITTSLTIEKIIESVPDLECVANIKSKQFKNIPSWSINVSDMFCLWQAIQEEYSEGTNGVVVTHGTDTLEETAYFLSLCHNRPQPLVITGAMRNSSEIGADGPRNILHSVLVAAEPRFREAGVLVVINDKIFSGFDVNKVHSWHTSAFSSPYGPVGEIAYGNIMFNDIGTRKHDTITNELKSVDYTVPIFKTWSGKDTMNFLSAWKTEKIDGLIVEGTGAGNVHPSILDCLTDLSHRSVPVIITTRVQTGGALPVYGGAGGGQMLSENNFILAQNLSAAKARLKLILLLGSGVKFKALKRFF